MMSCRAQTERSSRSRASTSPQASFTRRILPTSTSCTANSTSCCERSRHKLDQGFACYSDWLQARLQADVRPAAAIARLAALWGDDPDQVAGLTGRHAMTSVDPCLRWAGFRRWLIAQVAAERGRCAHRGSAPCGASRSSPAAISFRSTAAPTYVRTCTWPAHESDERCRLRIRGLPIHHPRQHQPVPWCAAT